MLKKIGVFPQQFVIHRTPILSVAHDVVMGFSVSEQHAVCGLSFFSLALIELHICAD
jgi:hypothetical protein